MPLLPYSGLLNETTSSAPTCDRDCGGEKLLSHLGLSKPLPISFPVKELVQPLQTDRGVSTSTGLSPGFTVSF